MQSNSLILTYGVIDLNFDRHEIEAMMFEGHSGSYFRHNLVQKPVIYAIVFLLLMLILILLEKKDEVPLVFYLLVVPLFLYYVYEYLVKARQIHKYRSTTKRWLDSPF